MALTILNVAEATHLGLSRINRCDIDAIIAGLNGSAVVLSGCAVTAQGSPDGTVAVAAGVVSSNGTAVAVSSGDVNVLSGAGSTAAHATLDRIDMIHADLTTGAKAVTAGTAAADTAVVAPNIPAGKVMLALIYVPATDTTVGSLQISDRRVISDSTVVHKYAVAITGGDIFETIPHPLNTRDLSGVVLWNNASPWDKVDVTWEATTTGSVTIRAGGAPLPAGYRAVISG